MVKGFLSQRGISYEERDVSRNRAYAQELVNNTGQMGVPVTVFDGQIVVGFDQRRLEQLVPAMKMGARSSFGASVADAGTISARQGGSSVPGAYVGKTKPGSAAQKAGLQSGDIIVQLNGKQITGAADLERGLAGIKPGSRFTLVFLRDGKPLSADGSL